MKIVLMMVTSLNGKITRGDDPIVSHWSSKEDGELFANLKKQYKVIVMGSKTFEIAKDTIPKNDNTLRIIMTKHPDTYKAYEIPGKFEFTSLSPTKLVDSLMSKGYSELLLVGGGKINALFFEEGLVSELHLTIEPQIFGNGRDLIADMPYHVQLQLIEVKKLNARGTLHLIYKVVR